MTTHPSWALEHKKKGTELRNIRGHYYLYEVTSKWDSNLKRSKKITGRMLGKITKEEGFIESDKERLVKQSVKVENLKIKEFGITNYIEKQLSELHKAFEETLSVAMADIVGSCLRTISLSITVKKHELSFSSQLFVRDLWWSRSVGKNVEQNT
ncbi:MAG: hypothetical protein JXR36_06090 [Bacteroidales bacterium]|nr:hypothetical protein [Bacteroidales bacterium]